MEYEHRRNDSYEIHSSGYSEETNNFCCFEKAEYNVECYTRHDLLIICSLDGELLCNIYGPDWDGGNGNKLQSFGTVMIGNDTIFVSYCGEDYARDSFQTKILVFDLEGNYLKEPRDWI